MELLVVIAIIGVLAALISVAVKAALDNAARSRISLELKNISGAIENFKNDYGAYPPNAMNPNQNPVNNPAPKTPTAYAQNDVVRMFKKAFPRNQEPPFLILALCGQNTTSGGPNLQYGMSAAEALYFWMGGFSDDPQYPISGPGGPSFLVDTNQPLNGEVLESRQPRYEFNIANLGPRNDDELDTTAVRSIDYTITINGIAQDRRIHFWYYRPSGHEQPIVYFDTSRHSPSDYDMPAYQPKGDDPWIYAVKQLRQGVTDPNGNARNLTFANRSKFQLLHCGIDGAWGETYAGNLNTAPAFVIDAEANNWLLFPDGPFVAEAADNMANFIDGKLEDAAEQ